MEKIRFEQVRKTYNGKSGCACGCNGEYTIPSHMVGKTDSSDGGWDHVSDRRAKIALGKINKAIDKFGPLAKQTPEGYFEYYESGVWFCYGKSIVAIDLGSRATTVYI